MASGSASGIQDENGASSTKSARAAPTLTFQGEPVAYRLIDSTIFLRKMAAFRLLDLLRCSSPKKLNEVVSRLVSAAGLDKHHAFLFEGCIASFVSTAVLRLIVNSDMLGVDPGYPLTSDDTADNNSLSSSSTSTSQSPQHHRRDLLLAEIGRIEGKVDQLTIVRTLELRSFGTIRYQIRSSSSGSAPAAVFLDTIRLMRLAGLVPHLVYSAPSKAHSYVRKLLQDRGIVNCFLKHRNSKYAFLSLKAALCLLDYVGGDEAEGDQRHRERTSRLRRELLSVCQSRQLLPVAADEKAKASSSSSQLAITVSTSYPAIRYKIKSGRLFLHRN